MPQTSSRASNPERHQLFQLLATLSKLLFQFASRLHFRASLIGTRRHHRLEMASSLPLICMVLPAADRLQIRIRSFQKRASRLLDLRRRMRPSNSFIHVRKV